MKFEHERSETFTSTREVRAFVSTRSGDVSVDTHEGRDVLVTLGTQSGAHRHLLEQAEVVFDAESNTLKVRSQVNDGFDSITNFKDFLKKKTWTDGFKNSIDVRLLLPHGSSVEIASVSGDTEIEGDVAHVRAATASGDVVVKSDVASLDVKSASGDVRANQVLERFQCQSASGDVYCTGTAAATVIRTASGDVDVRASRPGSIAVRAVSGDVSVAVAKGLAVDVNGTSVSGDMASSIALDDQGDGASASETVNIDVTTISGDVHIDRAP